jgi:hypothetical protein
MCRDYEQLLRSSQAESYILRIFFVLIHKFLLGIALNDILRLKTVHAVIVEEDKITCVQ